MIGRMSRFVLLVALIALAVPQAVFAAQEATPVTSDETATVEPTPPSDMVTGSDAIPEFIGAQITCDESFPSNGVLHGLASYGAGSPFTGTVSLFMHSPSDHMFDIDPNYRGVFIASETVHGEVGENLAYFDFVVTPQAEFLTSWAMYFSRPYFSDVYASATCLNDYTPTTVTPSPTVTAVTSSLSISFTVYWGSDFLPEGVKVCLDDNCIPLLGSVDSTEGAVRGLMAAQTPTSATVTFNNVSPGWHNLSILGPDDQLILLQEVEATEEVQEQPPIPVILPSGAEPSPTIEPSPTLTDQELTPTPVETPNIQLVADCLTSSVTVTLSGSDEVVVVLAYVGGTSISKLFTLEPGLNVIPNIFLADGVQILVVLRTPSGPLYFYSNVVDNCLPSNTSTPTIQATSTVAAETPTPAPTSTTVFTRTPIETAEPTITTTSSPEPMTATPTSQAATLTPTDSVATATIAATFTPTPAGTQTPTIMPTTVVSTETPAVTETPVTPEVDLQASITCSTYSVSYTTNVPIQVTGGAGGPLHLVSINQNVGPGSGVISGIYSLPAGYYNTVGFGVIAIDGNGDTVASSDAVTDSPCGSAPETTAPEVTEPQSTQTTTPVSTVSSTIVVTNTPTSTEPAIPTVTTTVSAETGNLVVTVQTSDGSDLPDGLSVCIDSQCQSIAPVGLNGTTHGFRAALIPSGIQVTFDDLLLGEHVVTLRDGRNQVIDQQQVTIADGETTQVFFILRVGATATPTVAGTIVVTSPTAVSTGTIPAPTVTATTGSVTKTPTGTVAPASLPNTGTGGGGSFLPIAIMLTVAAMIMGGMGLRVRRR